MVKERSTGQQNNRERVYLCIDLKSFYASVECVERGLDPMTTDLVVADPERSDRTICLAVSPSLKAKGVHNRCRVFEIPKHLDYIMATPRMQKYIEYSAEIYGVYLDYIAPEDMHVYSIDEVFMDVTEYLKIYHFTPREMALFLMEEVRKRVGVRATAGIGTNLYLAKIALDITAKHAEDYIGYLDRDTYINTLWDHRPLTDFWRIGPGTARKLARIGIDTMRGIARTDEAVLYRMFGIDAELLIDHAWGIEPTTMYDIHHYRTSTNSLSSGQVLMRDYDFEEGLIIIKEMTEQLCSRMSEMKVVSKSMSIAVGYSNAYKLPMVKGSASLITPSNATSLIVPAIADAYRRIVNPVVPVRRMYVNINNIIPADSERQMTLFDSGEVKVEGSARTASEETIRKDTAVQSAVDSIRNRYGSSSMFRGMDLEEAATTLERNGQIGGHRK